MSLTGVAGAAAQLVAVSGNNQTGAVGAALPGPLVVEVRDQFGNVVQGASVTFSVGMGGGSVNPATVQATGQNGRAQVTATLGSTPGAQQFAATASGIAPVAFSATALSSVITTVAGNGAVDFSGDGGPATSAQLTFPHRVAVDGSGNLFIADLDNNRIRKVAPSGIISTVAGNGIPGYSGDGGPATSARLKSPFGVAVDGSGNLFIADNENHRIRKITAAGIISTVAGTGIVGFSGDGGPANAAQLTNPSSLAVDGLGNLFIGDSNNHRVRKVTPSGIISTVAGNGTPGYSGDGGLATSARLYAPYGVAVDLAGNLFIAEITNVRVRKVTPSGVISTVAGIGTEGFTGDGGPAISAKIGAPHDVAVDGLGNLFISDYDSDRIRKVTPAGIISTVAGNGIQGFSGDGGPATSAQINGPQGVAVDGSGNLFIADSFNKRIRKVTGVTP